MWFPLGFSFLQYLDDVVKEMTASINCEGAKVDLESKVWKVATYLYVGDAVLIAD